MKMTAALQRHRFRFRAAGRQLCAERLTPTVARPGPALVFLHEGLGSIDQWRRFPEELCLRVGLPGLVYERWGYGQSERLVLPRPDDYLEQEARQSLPEVLAACDITQPPILFGHSDGASIALLFAAAYPQQVHAVISEAAHVFIETVCLEGIRQATTAYQAGPLRAGLQRYHGDGVDAIFAGWHETWLRPSRRYWDITAELPRITCPTLLIQGADDEYATRAQLDRIADGVSGTTTVLWPAGCGHTPHHQARELILDAATRFIATVGNSH